MIDFEWTVKFGDVLTVGGAAVVAVSIFYKRGSLEGKASEILKNLAEDFSEMRREFNDFRKTVTDVAIQKTQIDFLLKAYDELRRGVGKIDN